jgi:predicted dehydrogenase
MMSCSALRYSRELAEARADLAAIGPIIQATGAGPNELIFYGVHPLELAYTVMGPGVEWVQNIGDETNALVRCAYSDGRAIVLQVLGKAEPGLQAAFFGERGWRLVEVRDAGSYYHAMLTEFVSMVQTGLMPIPLNDTLEIMEILAAGKQSRQEGGSRIHLGCRRGPQRRTDNDREQ